MGCPRCGAGLNQSFYNNSIVVMNCPVCHGKAVTMSGLRALGVEPENTTNIWRAAQKGKLGTNLCCPECGKEMQIVKVDDGTTVFYIDVCTQCHLIWFDAGELEKIPIPPQTAAEEDMPQRAREILAIHQTGKMYPDDDDITPAGTWMYGHLAWTALRIILRLFFKLPL